MQLTKAEIIAENEKLEARVKEFQTHFDRLDKENYNLKEELSDLKSRYEASREIIKGRNSQIENLKKSLKGMTVIYKETYDLSKSAADQAAESIKNVEFWVNQNKIAKESARKIGTELLKAQQENKELWELLDGSSKEVERLSGVEDALLADIEVQKQHAISMMSIIEKLNNTNDEFKDKALKYLSEWDKSDKKFIKTRNELTQQIDEKEIDISALRRSNSDFSDNLKSTTDLLGKFKAYLMISGGCLVGCVITLVYLLINR